MIMTENSNDIYVGSTAQTLKQRLHVHKSYYRTGLYCSSSEILKQGNYKIVLIKNFACNSRFELETEETKYQRDLVCVNKNRARITKEEKLQYDKQYKIDNKDSIKQKKKQYNKQYYIDNREKRKQYLREYRARKKRELLESKKTIK